MITLKYSEISNFTFAQAFQKIASTQTHGEKASQIHKVAKALTYARDQISKEFQEKVVAVWGQKDAEGNLIRPEGEPNGFKPLDGKEEEFFAAQEEFGKTEVSLKCEPFSLQLLSDVKLSASDLEALKGVYAGNAEEIVEAAPKLQAVN